MEKEPTASKRPLVIRWLLAALALLTVAGIGVGVFFWLRNGNFDSAFKSRLAANENYQLILSQNHQSHGSWKHPAPPKATGKVVMLFWEGDMWWPEHKFASDPSWHQGSAVPVEITYDRNRLSEAHIVVVPIKHEGAEKVEVEPWQVLAHLTLEPTLARKNLQEILQRGQMLISYSRWSDVQANYKYAFYGPNAGKLTASARMSALGLTTRVPDFKKKRQDAAGSFFISDCSFYDAPLRISYLRRLMQHMSLHSYGKCLHNQDSKEPAGTWDDPEKRAASKFNLSSSYYFTFCMENTVFDDYVTEKFYECLRTDAIPIYLGAPNIREYLPNLDRKVIINVLEWPDPKKLADYLKSLMKDEKAYMEYFQWRSEPVLSQFEDRYNYEEHGPQSWISRAAQWYRDHQQ